MGIEQGSKTVSVSSHRYNHKQSSPEQRQHSRDAARREACMNHQSYLRGEDRKPLTPHGYHTHPGIGNIYGTPPAPAGKATGSRESPLVMGNQNKIKFQYNIGSARYQPDIFAGSRMVRDGWSYNSAYPPPPAVSFGSVDELPPPPAVSFGSVEDMSPPRQAGGSTTANYHTTQYGKPAFSYVMPPKQELIGSNDMPPLPRPRQADGSTTANYRTTQYGENAFSSVMAPKQQNLEFHLTDDEGPCDTDRKRHAYQRYLYNLTGNSRKLMPAGDKKQPRNKSTAVSPGHHGGAMGTTRRSRLCESESESEDSD